MSDLIRREDAIDAVHYYIESGYKCDIFQELKDLPSAEPERTAKVEKVTRVSSVIRTGRCGNCGYDVIDSYKHCPNCGARLDWGE